MDESYYQMSRPEIAPLMPQNVERVLEIGCAAGGFSRNFPAGIDYWGVEPVASVADIAAKVGIKVLQGTYEAVGSRTPDAYFDAVVCNDVIEHVVDTDAFLKSIRRKIKPNGCLIGSIPNVRFIGILKMLLMNRDWRYEDSGIMDRTHMRFFTPKSFRRVLLDNGFDVVILEGIGSRRLAIIKKIAAPLLWLIGEDVCHMQYRFRCVLKTECA